jgi:hypothetical protein
MAFIKFCVVTIYALTKRVIVRISNRQSVKSQIYVESDGSIRIYMITFSKNCFYVDNKYETETKMIRKAAKLFKDYQVKCLHNTSLIFQFVKARQDKDI